MDDVLFSQLSTFGASLALLFGIILLWRRGLRAYVGIFRWQSAVLSAMFVVIGYFGDDPQLYLVAVCFFALKVLLIPWLLNRLQVRSGAEREITPYVNVATS